jgi:CrcB protein
MAEPWKTYLLVALGSAFGGVGRFWVSAWVAQRWGAAFPWGTLVVNVSGSLLIGFLAALMLPEGRLFTQPSARVFLMVGICGGYTTFSSFSLQTFDLIRDGQWFPAAANAVLSVVLCLVAVWLGHFVGEAINR